MKLTEGSGGIFDVLKNGKVLYSKRTTGRFPEDGELLGLIKKLKAEG